MSETEGAKISITPNGPYVVTGAVPLAKQFIEADADGTSRSWREGQQYQVRGRYELCRCGHSSNKPFCDSTHETIGFKARDRASRKPYIDQAEQIPGPALVLTDAERLCAFARFCDADGQIWNSVEEAESPESQEMVKEQAGKCPAGRLVIWTREPLAAVEPNFQPSLGLVEDPQMEVSGPIWVRGGIPIEANGATYEIRNRVALCRCGGSQNKPFCDGTHASIKFTDEK